MSQATLFHGTESLLRVFIKPAEVHVAWDPTIITTLLGSCVAVVLFHPSARVTAVSHSILPYQGGEEADKLFRFVDSSVHYMLDSLANNGVVAAGLEVKLFGGADSLRTKIHSENRRIVSVGQQNIAAARKVLMELGLSVSSEKVGGDLGYKLYIRSDTGQVMLRHLGTGLSESELGL